jgi:hypothetical protein
MLRDIASEKNVPALLESKNSGSSVELLLLI